MNLKKIFLVITFLAVSIGIFGMNSPITKAITTEELLVEINKLQAQIAQLQKQLTELQGKPAAWCHNFNTNLRFGDSGLEVEALQTALEKEGLNVSGDTKGNFDEYTASAVVSFQEKYKSEILGPWGMEHGTGYVGKTTRAKLNELYGCGQIGPVILWQRTYGGRGTDQADSVIQTSDGGYIIVGVTESFGVREPLDHISDEGDIYLIKTDGNGNIIWEKYYDVYEWNPGWEEGYSVIETNDGGYIIAGLTESFGGSDVYLIKVDANGNLIWQKNYGPGFDVGRSFVQTSDGGYVIVGYTASYSAGGVEPNDVYLIKTDSNGNMIWQKTYGSSRTDEGRSIAKTNDGGYIIVGYSESRRLNDFDVYLIKTDANGNLIWQKTYGGSGWDQGFYVTQTSDGGYIIGGETTSYSGWMDVYLIKTDANGNLLWQKTYGGPELDSADSVLETNDGGYIIVGTTSSYGAGDLDIYLIKTDSSGNMIWQKTFGTQSDDIGRSIAKTSDGGYVIAGCTWAYETEDDVWLIKIAGE